MKTIHVVFGTRPELIKLLPVIIEIKKQNKIKTIVINTNQHDQLLDESLIKIVKPFNLNIKKHKLLEDIFIEILTNLNSKIKKSDGIIVQGDTATTLASSMIGMLKKIKIFHVEAGLRTYNKNQPFPEEYNRVITSQISDMHFAPTKLNKNNLLKEKIMKDNIFITGNTIIDSVKFIRSKIIKNKKKYHLFFKKNYNIDTKKKFFLFTCHRRELTINDLENIVYSIKYFTKNYNINMIFPIHANPKIKKYFTMQFSNLDNINIIANQDYDNFLYILDRCEFVLTDSGGIQEEASYLNKKTIVIRNTTERKEILKSQNVKLVGYSKQKILKAMKFFYEKNFNEKLYLNVYGTGKASKIIVKSILKKINA